MLQSLDILIRLSSYAELKRTMHVYMISVYIYIEHVMCMFCMYMCVYACMQVNAYLHLLHSPINLCMFRVPETVEPSRGASCPTGLCRGLASTRSRAGVGGWGPLYSMAVTRGLDSEANIAYTQGAFHQGPYRNGGISGPSSPVLRTAQQHLPVVFFFSG